MKNNKVIAFTSVRRFPEIFRVVLDNICSVLEQNKEVMYWFYDDNDDQETSMMLSDFIKQNPTRTTLLQRLEFPKVDFIQDEDTHHWNSQLVDKVIAIKNLAIKNFLETDATALFLFDSDIVFIPKTIEHLAETDADIITEIFWTRFAKDECYLPNVWDIQTYKHCSPESILKLKVVGQFIVGGLGASVFIRRKPLVNGLSYTRIESLDFWGEDRHFSVRASVLGYDLYVDTVYPAYHIYRKEQVEECKQWMASGYPRKFFSSWLNAKWEEEVRDRFKKKEPSKFRKLIKAIKSLR